MAIYTHAARTSATASGAASWELRSAAGARLYIKEIGIFMAAATASTFGLGRPAAIGVTPTAPVTAVPYDPADAAATATTALAWTTGPTVPTVFVRRIGLPAVIGAGVIWTFPDRQLIVPVSSSLVIWNLALNGVVDTYVVYEE